MPDLPDPAAWLTAGTLVAAVATAGSLFFSLGLGLVPCDLCWYQRILMYPLVVVLGVATVELRPAVWKTALPLSLAGLALASYHSVLQVTSSSCAFGGACAAIQWRLPILGLTIPNLSLLGFALVTISVVAGSGLVGGEASA
ncbi:disulfide bond formation protein B [Halorientalis regularis]|jgi:disulfide bond formation protein DsbB|uniref:Disulfide bond formation protein DsbB n=1 Tax=Halorientalis regularis TaxID=660518 RepID=A0A1G7QTR2_9EURY|nr:disulfide bond formation protein B [Halorientalis regularis]SDG01902.1 disulfide bond formation protein DsbB [Halorientalis regularis]